MPKHKRTVAGAVRPLSERKKIAMGMIGLRKKKQYGPDPPAEHRFKPGNPGKPKGTKDRLSRNFISALSDDFDRNGVSVIRRVRKNDPGLYLRIIASLVPKEMTISAAVEVSDAGAKLRELLDKERKALAPPTIVDVTPNPPPDDSGGGEQLHQPA
jgi:hypothetical protein